jgi:hypothetical protein
MNADSEVDVVPVVADLEEIVDADEDDEEADVGLDCFFEKDADESVFLKETFFFFPSLVSSFISVDAKSDLEYLLDFFKFFLAVVN